MTFHPLATGQNFDSREFDWKYSFSFAKDCARARTRSPLCALVLMMPLIVSLIVAGMEMTGMALASADMSEVYGIVGSMTKAWHDLLDRIQTVWEADSVAMIGSLISFFWILREISLS